MRVMSNGVRRLAHYGQKDLPFRWLVACVLVLLWGCAAQPLPATPSPLPPPTAPPATATPQATVTPTPLPGGIYIDVGKDMGKVGQFSLGTNHGPWAFLAVENWDLFKQSGINFIRFPGGNWGDENDLTNEQIDDYMTLVRLVNAEPEITVRLIGGTPEQAVDLLRYTITKKYNVHYWSIGNEPSLYAAKDSTWNTQKYNVEWRKFATALKAQDPTIKLIGPDIHQFTGNYPIDPIDSLGKDWLDEFLKANGDLVDVVSIHRYPFPAQKGDAPPSPDVLFTSAREWDQTIPNLRARIKKATGHDLPVGVMEFNSDWVGKINGKTTADSVNGALYIADTLGRMMRQHVDIIAQFTLQMSAGSGSLGIFDHYDPRPVYFVYTLYKQFGNNLVAASSDDVQVPVYAAKRADGTLTIVILNVSDQAKTKPLVIPGLAASARADAWLFDVAHKAEKTGSVSLTPDTQITLPPSSMSLYVIPPK